MIKPYNTTIEHTQRLRAQGLRSLYLLNALLSTLTFSALTLSSPTLPSLSASPLEHFKMLLRSERGDERAFEVSARSLTWSEDARKLSLKGEVRVWRSLKGEGAHLQRVELRCEVLEAHFNPQASPQTSPHHTSKSPKSALEGLSRLTLIGGVSLSAPGLALSAQRADWRASEGLLSLQGEVKGRWGDQRVRASHAQVWLERGVLVAESVRATFKLPRQRSPRVNLER